MADDVQTWPTSITWQGNSICISSHWTERRFDSNKSTIDLIIWKAPWLAIMTSVDADLSSGRRWKTGRRSESIRYILNNISFILYSFLTYLYCRKILWFCQKVLKNIYHQDAEFLIAKILCLVDVFCNIQLFLLPMCSFIRVRLHTGVSHEKTKRSYPGLFMSRSIIQMMFFPKYALWICYWHLFHWAWNKGFHRSK